MESLPETTVFDAILIGGGVVGCAVLRALALDGHHVALLERSADILDGASKGNSAILHTGFDAPSGSLEQRLMQEGRRQYLAIRDGLNLPLLETDAVLAAWSTEEAARLPAILQQAHANGVGGVRPLPLEEARSLHPHLGPGLVAALAVPGEHIIDPWSAPLAYALQAMAHGAEVYRQAEVTQAQRQGDVWVLTAGARQFRAKIVINCAGNHGDHVEALARTSPFRIMPRKGQFVVFDKSAASLMPRIVLPVPNARTKGVVLCPTIFGNVIVGPTAEDQTDRDAATVDESTLKQLIGQAGRMVPALAREPITATYAGLRPATEVKDYIIEALPEARWITVAGIRSTGLTAALGIGSHVAGLMDAHFAKARPVKDPVLTPVPNLAEHLPRDHQRIGRGALACLCELVTDDEVKAALAGPLPAGNLGGLKRRTRAMLGRCQGFNCLARICALSEGKLLESPPVHPIDHAA
jgi:glycerol-3-phosphate dehydrogenase